MNDRSEGRVPSPDVDEAAARVISALVDPPAHCPGCLAEAGLRWPDGATTRHCPRCRDRIRRVYQCARWNEDRAHQVAAGQANWDAFSARWRAGQGLPPLSVEAARRYVTAEMIRGPVGALLPEALRAVVHRAWCAGLLVGVSAWLADTPPPEPHGLWAGAPAARVIVSARPTVPRPLASQRPTWLPGAAGGVPQTGRERTGRRPRSGRLWSTRCSANAPRHGPPLSK